MPALMSVVRVSIFLLFVVGTAIVTPAAQSQTEESLEAEFETGSRFRRTVVHLQDAGPEMQADFASTALRALAEVYMAEADLARKQAGQQQSPAKLIGWSRAVDQYANQLALVVEDIDLGFPVELLQDDTESARVTVAGRAVILSHPRADQQATFEQRVLRDFCSRSDCKSLTARSSISEPIPVSASQIKPVWTFTGDGPVCSHAGIKLRFGSAENIARSRSTCKQLLQEVLSLLNEIAWQQRHGVTVDWDSLSIRPTPGRPEHLVQLNGAGDSILATLPLMYGSPDLLGDIRPWMQGRLGGDKTTDIQLQAARYGWEVAAASSSL